MAPTRRDKQRRREALESLLEQAAEAFDSARFDQVRALAEEAISLEPKDAEARHFRAAALLELGEAEAAREEYERAFKLAPEDPELALGLSELLICHPGEDRDQVERGLELIARARRRVKRGEDPELEFELWFLEGTALNQLGECARAVKALDAALALRPDSVDAELERGLALFESCRFAEAERAFTRVLERDPDEAWAHHHLGLIVERRGNLKAAAQHLRRAQRLSPADFPPPVQLEEGEFERAVEDAIARLPAQVREHLENTTIAVEPLPRDEDLTASNPPLSPAILGVFSGTPVGQRSVFSAFDHAPAHIVLYQRNLERFARTREELIEQIGITLLHEVGHLIGLDEEDLWERGLE